MKKILSTISVLFATVISAFAYGGSEAYSFLSLPASSQVAALGGDNVSLATGDVMLGQQNPALLSLTPSTSVGLSYVNYIADVQYGAVGYSQQIDSLSWWGVGVNFLSYGTLKGYNEFDQPTGDFSAKDMNLQLSYVRRLASRLCLGLSLKPVYSYIEDYSSVGLAMDLGAVYVVPEQLFSAGVAVRNFGAQFTAYDEHRSDLPWDIQLGVTKKLAKAPFRFSVTYVKLNKWNFDYNKVGDLYKAGDMADSDYKSHVGWGDMLLRHMLFGVEFVPSTHFSLAASYNHRRHKEYVMENSAGGSGWSFGAQLHVSKFHLGASYSLYGAGEGVFGISLSSCISDFKKN